MEIHRKMPATKPPINQMINHILCTNKLLKCIEAFVLPQYYLTLRDHRDIVINIDTTKLPNTSIRDMHHMNARKLICSNIKAVNKYETKLSKHFKLYRIKERTERLIELTKESKNGQFQTAKVKKMYEKIDSDVFRLCKNA